MGDNMKKLIAILLFTPMMAHAEFESGNTLLAKLDSANTMDRMFALGYILGVVDAYMNVYICPPANVTAGQINDMVRNYITNIPATRNRSADTLINEALRQVWPCKNQQRQSGRAA